MSGGDASAAEAKPVGLSRLSLSDFRNHEDTAIACDAAMLVLTGPNGAGKTNILEAVSLLVPGRGLRRAALGEMRAESGSGGFAVSARLSGAGVDLGTGTKPNAPDRRQVRINGADASANALSEWLSILWLTPAMDRLFMEGASGRRRFFDRLVLSLEPGHARAASRYEAAMRERNRLISGDVMPEAAWLDGVEAQMAEQGFAVAEARLRTLEALQARLAEQEDGPFARPSIALTQDRWASIEGLAEALRASRRADRAAGRSLVGPHRADMEVIHAQKGQEAALCSTGEQKALLISLILAQSELVAEARGAPPILLLDEIAAHLDEDRRAALFERLAGLGGQVWMTGTDRISFEHARGLGARFFHISGGRVAAEEA